MAAPDPRFDEIVGIVKCLELRIVIMSNALDAKIAELTASVAAQNGVVASLETLIKGFSAALSTATANLASAGVSAAELQELEDLNTAIVGSTAGMQAAITANPLPAAVTSSGAAVSSASTVSSGTDVSSGGTVVSGGTVSSGFATVSSGAADTGSATVVSGGTESATTTS